MMKRSQFQKAHFLVLRERMLLCHWVLIESEPLFSLMAASGWQVLPALAGMSDML